MSRPGLVVLPGGGDVVAALEARLAEAKRGEIVGFALAAITADGVDCTMFDAVEGTPFAWARLLAGTEWLTHRLREEGL